MDKWVEPTSQARTELIRQAKNVAIVGVSDNPMRASHEVAAYLLLHSHFNLFFVNPKLETLLGQPVYASLTDIPEPIDIVDVFRKISDIPQVLDEAIAINAKTFWMQLGLTDQESADRGVQAGMNVVQNRCLKIDQESSLLS